MAISIVGDNLLFERFVAALVWIIESVGTKQITSENQTVLHLNNHLSLRMFIIHS